MVAHVDTVAAYDVDQLGCREEEDVIEGLGASDMKGGCAAMIRGVSCVLEGTEVLSAGCPCPRIRRRRGGGRDSEARQGVSFPLGLIGEPSDMRPCFSHYGYFEIQITTTGKRKHASLANPGQNPVEAMLRLLIRISRSLTENLRRWFTISGIYRARVPVLRFRRDAMCGWIFISHPRRRWVRLSWNWKTLLQGKGVRTPISTGPFPS